MGHGLIDGDRIIFPVRQNVNQHKIRGRRHLRVFAPELPDIGISDRHIGQCGLDLADIANQLGSGDFAAQQGFVSHHNAPHTGWVTPGQFNDFGHFVPSENRITADQGPEQDFQSIFFGKGWNGFESGDRIGTDTVESAGENRQVCIDALV